MFFKSSKIILRHISEDHNNKLKEAEYQNRTGDERLETFSFASKLIPHIGGPYMKEEVVVVSSNAQRLK